jgi:N-acetyl-anhydromuramyl-L-alanine amidase AmpD
MSLRIMRHPVRWFNARPEKPGVNCIVLHADASPSVGTTLNWLDDARSRVSYHYLIGRLGHVYELVSPDERAWHAGKSVFELVPDVNDFSVGVCFSNNQRDEPFTNAQLASGVDLCAALMTEYPAITPKRITTHAHVSPGRKFDPGPRFPLENFLARVANAVQPDA